MKRIAYLCLSGGWGGLEMNQLRNAQQMQNRGHSVLLIANSETPIANAAAQANLPLYIVKQQPKHYQWVFAIKLARYLMDGGFEHLFFRNNRELSIAASVRFFSRGKVDVHYFMEMALGGKRTQFFRTLRYAFLSTWVCPLPYLQAQALQQTRIAAHKVKEIPSGLLFNAETLLSKEEARSRLQWPLDQKLILVVGRIDPKKRQAFVWDCFAQRTNNDEILVFVGESTPDEPSFYHLALQEKIKKHPKNRQVIWAGFHEKMELIYSAADVVISAADKETVGMVTLEALQNNCPVLGVNNGGSKEIIELFRGGLCFELSGHSSLSNRIDQILAGDFQQLNKRYFEQHFDFNHVCALVETEVLGLEAPIFQ
jgi:glycosyltransferase involved in cell wall biosynthesis